MASLRDLLLQAAARAADHREHSADGPVFPSDIDLDQVRAGLGWLRDEPTPAAAAIDELAEVVEPATRHLTAGMESADSWATDGHKWLNVPYDSGYAFCAHADAHAAAMSYTAAYLTGHGRGGLRAPADYVLESSRRARGTPAHAVTALVERTPLTRDQW